jgi:hypothetical protein
MNGDLVWDEIVMWFWDAEGNNIRVETDSNADGTADSITTNTFGPRSALVMSSQDTNADGTPDATASYVYDADGYTTHTERDDDADGNAEYRTDETIDDYGYVVYIARDTNGDGIDDGFVAYDRQYDADGNVLRIETDLDDDDDVDAVDVFTVAPTGWFAIAF